MRKRVVEHDFDPQDVKRAGNEISAELEIEIQQGCFLALERDLPTEAQWLKHDFDEWIKTLLEVFGERGEAPTPEEMEKILPNNKWRRIFQTTFSAWLSKNLSPREMEKIPEIASERILARLTKQNLF